MCIRDSYNAITPEAVKAMIEELKQQGMPVNGFLDKTQPVAFAQDGLVAVSYTHLDVYKRQYGCSLGKPGSGGCARKIQVVFEYGSSI